MGNPQIKKGLGDFLGRIYILLIIVMAIWGFNLSAVIVLVSNVDPITLTAFRIFVAGIAVLVITGLMGIFRLPTKREWKTIFIIAIFNVVLHHVFLGIGLTRTSGVNAGIILGAAPLVTLVFSVILLKDRITKLRLFGFILGFIGIIIISVVGMDSAASVSSGDILILLSMMAQAFSFILLSKLNPSFDPRLLTGYMLLVGSVFIFMTSIVVEGDVAQIGQLFTWKLGLVFLFSAIGATAFGHMTYNYAIKNVGPTETTIFVNLNTIFSLLGASFFLGEPILQKHYLGLTFIIIGVFIGSGTLEYLLKKRVQPRLRQK